MRDNFRPNVRLTTNILMVIGTFLIAFNLSKISTRSRDSQIKEDCSRWNAEAMTSNEFAEKYKLYGFQTTGDPAKASAANFCAFYRGF